MSASLDALPADVRRLIEDPADDVPAALNAISGEIARKRDEAKAARSSSGIEDVWTEAEDAYVGIDDANRHEFNGARWYKPMSMNAPVTTDRPARGEEHKSTAFLRLTSRYVDAGAAKLAEILLPADDKAFSFNEMPVPEVIQAKDDDSQVVHAGMGVPLTRPAGPGDQVAAGAPPPAPGETPPAQPTRVPLTVKDLANERIELMRKQAKAAETRVYNWMVETRYRAEVRKVITDAARIGVGVLKGPVPKSKRVIAVTTEADETKVIIRDKIIPSAVWVSPWNIYPDPACGENINDGEYVFEYDDLSARRVRDLKKLPGYIASQIDRVLAEGPSGTRDWDPRPDIQSAAARKSKFPVWYFYGTLTKEEMEAFNQASGQAADGSDATEVNAIVTMINDTAVRASINPLDSGAFPYHSMPWQRRSKSWAGMGVGEQIRTPQRIANAALRALLNNAGKSAGSQIVVDEASIKPQNGSWTITPDKVWVKSEENADVRTAFEMFEIPNMTDALTKIIELAERFAEETSSIPLITQGQSGATTPDTFGATQLQNNNANQLLRSIGYSFDDQITEPIVTQFYEWLLLDPDVPNEEKGEFLIDAHGSVALVERAIQDQTIAQMGGMATNPAFGIDPKEWAAEFLKSKRLDPGKFKYSPEKQEKIDSAPPPEAPAVTAAKINADAQLKLGIMKQQADQQNVQSEEKIAAAANALEGGKVQATQHQTLVESTVQLHQIQMEHDRALLDYANRRNISLDQAKAALAKTAMTLQTQKELNAADNAVDLHRHRTQRPSRGARPPAQLPGRAGNGRAFEQAPTP